MRSLTALRFATAFTAVACSVYRSGRALGWWAELASWARLQIGI